MCWPLVVSMSIGIQISVQVAAFNSFRYKTWSVITGWHNSSVFNFLTKQFKLFFTMAAWFYIFTNSAQGFQFLHIPTGTCYFLVFVITIVILVILVGMKWYVTVIVIYIFLMTDDAEHPLLYLLVIYKSSLERHLFRSFGYFFMFLDSLKHRKSKWLTQQYSVDDKDKT